MKKLLFILLISALYSCSSKEDEFIGKWIIARQKENRTVDLSGKFPIIKEHAPTIYYDTLEIKKDNGIIIIENKPFKYNKELNILETDLGFVKITARINDKNELVMTGLKTKIFTKAK